MIALVVSWWWEFRRRHIHRMIQTGCLVRPDIVSFDVQVFFIFFDRRLVWQYSSLTNSFDKFHDSLGLMFRRYKPSLGFRGRTQWHCLGLAGEVLHHVWIWIVPIFSDLVCLNPSQDIQLLLAEFQGFPSVRVRQAGPTLWYIDAVQKRIQGFPLCWTSNLLAIDIVANMRIRIVERQRDVANSVRVLGRFGVIRVVDWIDVFVDIAFVAVGIFCDYMVRQWFVILVAGTVLRRTIKLDCFVRFSSFRRYFIALQIIL